MIFLTYFYNHCIVIHVHFLFRYLTKSYWSLNYWNLSLSLLNWNYWNYWNVKWSVIVSVNQNLNVIWKNYCGFLMMNVLTNHLTFNDGLLNLCHLYLYIHQILYHHTIQGFLKHCSRY